MKLVQLSDTHLTHRGGPSVHNFEAMVRLLNDQIRPDVVVSTGDLALLDPDSAADRTTAKRLHDLIDAPLLVLPGNHDVGEPGPNPWAGIPVTSQRIAAFRSSFGGDRWVHRVGDWALVGLNSELLASGLPEEEEQWAWLDEVPAQVAGLPVVLFTHKPLWHQAASRQEHALVVERGARDRLLRALADVDLRAICSGHLHRYETGQVDVAVLPVLEMSARGGPVTTVSAPSSAFLVVIPELGGLEKLGMVAYEFGGGEVVPRLVRPADLDERLSGDVAEVVAERATMGLGPPPS